jgi:hypothetical protein
MTKMAIGKAKTVRHNTRMRMILECNFEVRWRFDANYDEVDVVALYELTKVAVARPRAEDSGAVLVACRDRREREIG